MSIKLQQQTTVEAILDVLCDGMNKVRKKEQTYTSIPNFQTQIFRARKFEIGTNRRILNFFPLFSLYPTTHLVIQLVSFCIVTRHIFIFRRLLSHNVILKRVHKHFLFSVIRKSNKYSSYFTVSERGVYHLYKNRYRYHIN